MPLGTPSPVAPPSIPTNPGGSVESLALWASSLVRSLSAGLNELTFRINHSLEIDGGNRMTNPLPLVEFLVATRPTASDWEGSVIYVSDGGAGAQFQASNGTVWVDLG